MLLCPPSAGTSCNLDAIEAKDDVEGKKLTLNKPRTFDFLKFEVSEDSSDDSNIETVNFEATATLVFRINKIDPSFAVVGKGKGSFAIKNGSFSSFALIWDPIAQLVINELGTFSFTFNPPELFGDDDEYDDDGGNQPKEAFVSATVTHISAVPLPAGMWMLLAGLGALGAVSLRKRQTA